MASRSGPWESVSGRLLVVICDSPCENQAYVRKLKRFSISCISVINLELIALTVAIAIACSPHIYLTVRANGTRRGEGRMADYRGLIQPQ